MDLIRMENSGTTLERATGRSPDSRAATTVRDLSSELLADALAPVLGDLEILRTRLSEFVPTHSSTATDVMAHIFRAGGKLVRPALFLMSSRLFGYRGEHLYPIAAVCEFVHTASLLHDDVVDSSSERRRRPTANSIWGDVSSVLVGDLIYSRASELMAATGKLELVERFARSIRLMSEGELKQLETVLDFALTEEEYLTTLSFKTATLIATSCRAAGILAEASSTQKDALESFGHALGLAFQLIDDALDFVGIQEAVGKRTLCDLADGRVTLPVMLLRERVATAERELLNRLFAQPRLTQEDIHVVAALVEKYETASTTIERASAYTEAALAELEKLPASPARDDLARMAESLLVRVI